jgi:alkylation response protein AidB-like acyl-CoA dehydrogenase
MASLAPYADPPYLTRGVSPYYRESHRRLQREARRYVDENLIPYCEEWERNGSVPAEVIRKHSDLGYMAVSVYPLAVDGIKAQRQRLPGDTNPDEWDGFHDLIVIDEVARCGYLGVIWALTCGNSIGAPPLVHFGTPEQKQKYLPDVLSGRSRFCLGVTEPDGRYLRLTISIDMGLTMLFK